MCVEEGSSHLSGEAAALPRHQFEPEAGQYSAPRKNLIWLP